MDDTLADPLAGRTLDGRYVVTARIAHGGMATVYRAMDTRLDREVALKVMHAELARDEEFRHRFIGEAKSVARLSHQNVVGVYDQGADGPFLYLTMEYVPGRTLKEMLRGSGRFPPATALEIMAGVLDGLAAAHASGIVHRDVKPENVLVTADGKVKVADFGLARAQWAAGHTRKGLLIGTVAYVPPEQVTGGSTGPRGDVYSAGVMLFELLTGHPPYTGDSPLSIAYQHVNQDVPAPSSVAAGIPHAVDQLVLAATSRDPARRPADADEFGRAVRGVWGGGQPSHEQGGSWGDRPAGVQSVMGVGVQGLGEAPWLDLDTPAATNGWWSPGTAAPGGVPGRAAPAARSGTGALEIPAAGSGAGAFEVPAAGDGHFGNVQSGNGYFGNGHSGGQPRMSQFHDGGFRDGGSEDSHTLVVDREADGGYDGGGYGGGWPGGGRPGGREPFLGRWLFGPRLVIVVVIVALGVTLGLGGWWLASGRFADVPSVAGDSVTQATAVLTADGFKVKQSTRVHSNTVAKGTVVGTSPAGRASKGTAVTILVSSGPFTSVVPDVKGKSQDAAVAALRAAHLAATVQKVGSDLPVGTVVRTNPPAGTTWPQTKPVTLMVAGGLTVPDFRGQDIAAAQQWAGQHHANLQQQPDNSSQQPQGTITGQTPAGNSLYKQGETITVDVSTGPSFVNVPYVIGDTVQQATRVLQAAGFSVQVNRYGPFKRVFDYSPTTQAPRGSTITLDVGGL